MDWADTVIRARLLVGALGETASPPWWRTQALTPAGQRVLARLFPRTRMTAGLQTTGHAAQIEHDRRIGRIGVFHLFRLPSADEATIYDRLQAPAMRDALAQLVDLDGIDARLNALAALAHHASGRAEPGPVLCGPISDLRTGAALPRICATYLAAFRAGAPAYPYLEEPAL